MATLSQAILETYNLVDGNQIFAHDAGHLANTFRVRLIGELFDKCSEEFGL